MKQLVGELACSNQGNVNIDTTNEREVGKRGFCFRWYVLAVVGAYLSLSDGFEPTNNSIIREIVVEGSTALASI